MNRSDKITLDQIKKLVPINADLINFAADVQTTIYPPALNGNGNGNGVVAPAYVSAVGGAPTDDTQWYKDWRYWAVIALIAAVLIYLYMRSKKGSGEEQPLVVEMSRYSNA